MGIISVDGNLLRKMIIAGSNELNKNKQLVDSLNVFPVPDGDTGTNMSLTVLSAAREVEKLNTPNIHEVAKAASNGALRGARGNSGVIVSQLFRGFAKGFEGVSVAKAEHIARAFSKAAETAYKAVMKPKEGTILTVAKSIGEKAQECYDEIEDLELFFSEIIKFGNEMLKRTQEMLPELKQAGVVDAGGKGLLCILEGAYSAINIKDEIKIDINGEESKVTSNVFSNIKTEDIKFSYCTEFLINATETDDRTEDSLKTYLSSLGDSIVVVVDEEIIKIHVHTNHPGKALEKALTLGSLSNIKIENMKEQHTNMINFVEERVTEEPIGEEKEVGFVSVSAGDGLKELFLSLGADFIIEGGQTMNPSAEDIITAVSKVNAKNIIVLPNNKNIILAAEQAKKLSEDKNIIVIPTKTIPQGISALVNYISVNPLEENIELMTDAIKQVKSGQITYAVRNTNFDGKEINEGDFLCMIEGKIELVSKDVQEGAKELVSKMIDDDTGLISIYFGEDTTEEKANEISDFILEKYPDCEVEVQKGGQPLYYYIISVE